jgi:NADH dehydrogenase [ubiquinone] 1 alpha subcomplex assembly factor 1
MRSSKASSRLNATAASRRSAQCPPTEAILAQACFIEVRATGKHFKLNLLTDDAFDSINYQESFAREATWQTLHAPLATFRGREFPGTPALEPARIRQVGHMLAERQAGAFALEVRCIGLA